MEGALDEIEAIGSRGGEMVGVPTGFADFDELTNGLHPGQMIVARRPARRSARRWRSTPLCHADRLDDDGRGRRRRPADRGGRATDDGRGGDRGHDRPALLRGRVRRRHGHRRRRRARLAAPRPRRGRGGRPDHPRDRRRRCGSVPSRASCGPTTGSAPLRPLQLADAELPVAPTPGALAAVGAAEPDHGGATWS